ncbi:MAG: tetratricopeptide repeat protein, partial [Planctomycetes bacterium]|nr:tetratricopeptide repeat protein [Planctomycetota bacterium]
RLEPDNIHVWLALGWCYKRIGRLDRAIESLEEALAVDPSGAIIHYNLACYWSLAGNVEVSLAYLTNAFEIDRSFRDLVYDEVDFDPIREHPAFRELTSVVV